MAGRRRPDGGREVGEAAVITDINVTSRKHGGGAGEGSGQPDDVGIALWPDFVGHAGFIGTFQQDRDKAKLVAQAVYEQ